MIMIDQRQSTQSIDAKLEATNPGAKFQLLRNLAQRIETVREEERRFIAQEIHDQLGQCLTALKMDLVWLSNHLADNPATLSRKLTTMIQLVDNTHALTRNIAMQLRPPILDDLGLDAAVEWEVKEFCKRAGCEYTLDMQLDRVHIDLPRRTAVFRTLQEALTNIARHARATHITVSLYDEDNKLILLIHDNGVGINMERLHHSNSLGMVGMRERAHMFGGQIYFKNAEDGGTIVRVEIPLKKTA